MILVNPHLVTFLMWGVEQSVGHQSDSLLLPYLAVKQYIGQTQATKKAVWLKLLLQELNTHSSIDDWRPVYTPRNILRHYSL